MNWIKRLSLRIGFRGSFLFLLAISDFGHGIYYCFAHPNHAPVNGNHFWGIVFFALGAFLLAGVPVRRIRHDRWFFVVSGFVMTVWSLNYLWAVLSVPYQWGDGIAWLAFSVLSFLMVPWPEPRYRKLP